MARRGRKPSFFKVLLNEFTKKLKIPPNFYMHFDAKGPQRSLLRTPIGTWSVHMKKVDDAFFFVKGWKKFVHDNDLKLYEFLVFRYAGNSKFDVDIFGRNGCKKMLVMANTVIDIESDTSMDDPETEENQEDFEIGMEYETKEDQLSDDSEIGLTREHLSSTAQVKTRTPREAAGLARALEAANKYSSKNPFFKIVMRPAYLKKGIPFIPKSFEDYAGRATYVTVQDSKSRQWRLKCIYYHYGCRFSAGWHGFAKHHSLKVGDVCVFEMINRNDVVLKVSIFRGRKR